MKKILHNGEMHTEVEIKEIVQEYYASVFSKKRDRHVQMQELFPKILDRSARILDFGCGMGGGESAI